MWFVYLAQNVERLFYTGIALDPDRRMLQHNGVRKGGAKATRGKGPWLLVYTEAQASKGDALRREIAIKRLSRKQKALLAGIIPV